MTLWMLYAILFGGLAAVGGIALERGARALSLPTRFVWVAALGVAIAGPLLLPRTKVRATVNGRVELVERETPAAGAATPMAVPPTVTSRLVDATRPFDRPATWLWLTLATLCVGRVVAGMVSLRRKRGDWVATEIAGTPCFVTPDIGPAVVAIPDTRIVLPEWALSLDQGSLATVVRHERQHFSARDAYLIVAGSLAVALIPWNPAMWFVRRRLRLALEMDCDARVLAEDPRVDRYGSLLLAIAQRPRLAAGLAATLTESTSDLERRIQAMTTRPPRHPHMRAFLFTIVGVVAIAIACAMPGPDLAAPPVPNAQPKPIASGDVQFDFQVEKPASARPDNAPPMYPTQLRAANIEGQVLAKFVVDTNGFVDLRTFEIIKSDHDQFSAAVRGALPNLRFYPARVGGRAVKQLVQMPFSFSLVRSSNVQRERNEPRVARAEFTTASTTSRPHVLLDVPEGDGYPTPVNTNVMPAYPAQLRAAGIQGTVWTKFVVRADGAVDMSSLVITRSDHDAFTASVRAALEKWRFTPAMKDGKPAARLIGMPVMFRLTE